jgi:hypothetical protein
MNDMYETRFEYHATGNNLIVVVLNFHHGERAMCDVGANLEAFNVKR